MCDGDVAFPEHQIAAPQFAERRQFAERHLLHIAVAWANFADGMQCDLHQAGAIETERCLAAPQIRCVQEFLSDSDEITLPRLDRRQMRQWQMPASGGDSKMLVLR